MYSCSATTLNVPDNYVLGITFLVYIWLPSDSDALPYLLGARRRQSLMRAPPKTLGGSGQPGQIHNCICTAVDVVCTAVDDIKQAPTSWNMDVGLFQLLFFVFCVWV